MATAHLLFGFLGAGKTTLAKELERRHAAVRFTPDEWMARLFGEDPPAELFEASAGAILAIMEPLWLRCLSLGVDVVLDYGLWRRAERDYIRGLVQGCGGLCQLKCTGWVTKQVRGGECLAASFRPTRSADSTPRPR